MKAIEKVALINEALVKSGAAIKESAKAEIIDGKILYSKERKNSLGTTTKIRLTLKEIIWMTNGNDARNIIKLVNG